MATKTKDAPPVTEEAPVAPGSKRKLLLIAGPVVLALLAAWFFLLGPGSGPSSAQAAVKKPGEVLALEPITMNLADGRLLKVGLALQLPEGAHEISGSVALDEAISFLGAHSYAQLAPPAARQKAKQELSHRVAERYHGEVMEVYFTEFVMQ
jgi:flagellar FliL protein